MVSKKYILAVLLLACCFISFAQSAKSKIKAQIALGVNSPSTSGFVENFEAQPINFPTVNFGVQYMLKEQWGAKLDFGFNRFSNSDNSPEFKDNYSRFNVQLVYDAKALGFLPERIGLVGHVGPGYTFVKPLGNFANNNISLLNVMGGIEIHYGMTDTISLFTDVSYIYGLGNDFDPVSDGFGSFNGNLTTITFGISFSLSGCYYCNQ